MVYVVERYLPGLSRSDLLHGLKRAQQQGEAAGVRYLGSTVVLEDEACFCQFEGPTEAAVAEANRRAGLPFDRIVSAVTVQPERRTTMNVSTAIPATVEIRRGRLLGLIVGVAAAAAAVTWAVLAFGADSGSGQAQANMPAQPAIVSSPIPMSGYLEGITSRPTVVAQPSGARPPDARDTGKFPSIMSFTPAELSAGAVWGYALPSAPSGLTRESVLSSLSPKSRRYIEALTGLTFEQLGAGAAGSP
jgi:Nickel responsive protein SCO4226-like